MNHTRAPTAPRRRACGGFTLVEVLVALGIVAIALMAGIQATSALASNAMRQSEVMLAQLCAENEQVKVRLARQMPALGTTSVACEQAGRQFTSLVDVLATPNPNFRRIDVKVMSGGHSVLQLSSVVGMY